jgi:hypothetical protein
MSEIQFVNALGDAIEAAIAERASSRDRRRSRRWVLRGRGRLIVALAVLLLGGAAFAATLQSSRSLATAGLACYEGTGTDASAYYDVENHGRSPQAACAEVFRASGPRALAAPGVQLIACVDPHGYVAVFRSNGAPGQCTGLRMSPLQTASYALAEAGVQRLLRQLRPLTRGGACVPAHTLEADADRVLRQLGWRGWHTALRQQLSHRGPCARFEATGSSISDPAASLDAKHRTVWIVSGHTDAEAPDRSPTVPRLDAPPG